MSYDILPQNLTDDHDNDNKLQLRNRKTFFFSHIEFFHAMSAMNLLMEMTFFTRVPLSLSLVACRLEESVSIT